MFDNNSIEKLEIKHLENWRVFIVLGELDCSGLKKLKGFIVQIISLFVS